MHGMSISQHKRILSSCVSHDIKSTLLLFRFYFTCFVFNSNAACLMLTNVLSHNMCAFKLASCSGHRLTGLSVSLIAISFSEIHLSCQLIHIVIVKACGDLPNYNIFQYPIDSMSSCMFVWENARNVDEININWDNFELYTFHIIVAH